MCMHVQLTQLPDRDVRVVLNVYLCVQNVLLQPNVFNIVWAVFSILRYVRRKYPLVMILLIVEWQEE